MDLGMIKAIIESLRNPANRPQPGIETIRPGLRRRTVGDMNPVGNTRNDINYVKYKRQQEAIGESPVSYEEWIDK